MMKPADLGWYSMVGCIGNIFMRWPVLCLLWPLSGMWGRGEREKTKTKMRTQEYRETNELCTTTSSPRTWRIDVLCSFLCTLEARRLNSRAMRPRWAKSCVLSDSSAKRLSVFSKRWRWSIRLVSSFRSGSKSCRKWSKVENGIRKAFGHFLLQLRPGKFLK